MTSDLHPRPHAAPAGLSLATALRAGFPALASGVLFLPLLVPANRDAAPSRAPVPADLALRWPTGTGIASDGPADPRLQALAMLQNEQVPIEKAALVIADPYQSFLEGEDRQRAINCLAAAAWYEAGTGESDQLAVMQVILNRVRHRAFPNSVCGVVFQGSERRTGCQFTFTCDGSIRRRQPGAAALASAQERARAMLDGERVSDVGVATHYHADYVYPYWAPSLVKIANVNRHIFYRWGNARGGRAALSALPSRSEPMAGLGPGPATPTTAAADTPALAYSGLERFEPGHAASLPRTPEEPPAPLVQAIPLAAGTAPGRLALTALDMCEGKSACIVAGWEGGKPVRARLSPESLSANPPDFLFLQVSRERRQLAFWNCAKFERRDPAQCIDSAARVRQLVAANGFTG